MSRRSIVHLVRHGQVHNPSGILYGRLPGYGLSELGRQMAERLGEYFAGADLAHLRSSPLQRAQETIAPIAAQHPQLEVVEDARLIEADNAFTGQAVRLSPEFLLKPQNLWYLRNPLRPSWGEPYQQIAARMHAAIADAAIHADDAEAVIVAHELPIWMARLSAEGRPLIHDPRRRQVSLASVTSLTVVDGRVARVSYAEPARDLVPSKKRSFRPGQ